MMKKISNNYWLMKSEPDTYSWQDLKKDSTTAWDGVRNYQARNNMQKMKVGDLVFFYHSVKNPSIVGIAKVSKESYPDKTDPTNKFVCVDLEPVEEIKSPIPLSKIKQTESLSDLYLIKQSRLSVMPISKKQWDIILSLA